MLQNKFVLPTARNLRFSFTYHPHYSVANFRLPNIVWGSQSIHSLTTRWYQSYIFHVVSRRTRIHAYIGSPSAITRRPPMELRILLSKR